MIRQWLTQQARNSAGREAPTCTSPESLPTGEIPDDIKLAARERFDAASQALAKREFSLAEVLLREALHLFPAYVDAHCNLGGLLRDTGRHAEAGRHLQTALQLEPANSVAAYNLAMILLDEKQWNRAVPLLEIALNRTQGKAETFYWLGNALMGAGDHVAAQRAYESAFRLQPMHSRARWGFAMAKLPAMVSHESEYAQATKDFEEQLARLQKWFQKNPQAVQDLAVGAQQPFFMAYIPGNHKELMGLYGALCSSLMRQHASLISPKPAGKQSYNGKIKVAIVSAHISEHSVWRALVRGWIAHFDHTRFELHVFHVGAHADAQTRWAAKKVATFHQGPKPWQEWVQLIHQFAPQILLYPEVGMDATTLRLAAQRLAPRQLAAWGHPVTTGLPTIDAYISARAFEPADAQSAYSEKLIPLPGIGACYQPYGTKATNPDLSAWGLRTSDRFFVCAGTPMKYSPADDTVWLKIARACNPTVLLFFKKAEDTLADQLEARLRRAFKHEGLDFDAAIRFIPWQSQAAFFGILRNAVAYLDTIEFSGFNTAMQAIECGTPIVAFEGTQMRGRFASGILRSIQLDEWVATDRQGFIRLANELNSDESRRQVYQRKMTDNRASLYDDVSPVIELSRNLLGD